MKFQKKSLCILLSLTLLFPMSISVFAAGSNTVNVSDYIAPDTGVDAADTIQKIIDENPNRTINFPDGEYIVSKPILTPADPEKSVSLKMTDYTVIKATGDWEKGEAVIQLGGKDPANTTHDSGSNYSLEGGVIDGNGVADGVSINSGRETSVRYTSIKNTVTGLHIMYGANSGSSDADIFNVNIIGTGTTESVGVLLEGHDNTLTNMRIGYVFTGVVLKSSGNMLRNIHPLYYSDGTDYENSCGFYVDSGNNWLDFCYSDQFAQGFVFTEKGSCTMNDCFCMWYCTEGPQTAIVAQDEFNSVITNFTIGFQGDSYNTVMKTGSNKGTGTITNLDASNLRAADTVYKAYEPSQNIFEKLIRLLLKFFSIFSTGKFTC